MNLNLRSIIIVFLVAMLGAGLGTFGVLELYNKDNKQTGKSDIVIQQVQYGDISKTDCTKAIDKAYNTVVEITADVMSTSNYFFYTNYTSTAAGSGVIISSDGYIVTNEHVIDQAYGDDPVHVRLFNGDVYSAAIIGYDTRSDIALLKIDASDLAYSEFADSNQLVMGQDAIAIGNPLGTGISCSNGIVSALEKEIYVNNFYMNVIQTNAAVNEGNSGGGLFDINGNIIGIVNAKKSSSMSTTTVEGMSYAIPSNTVVRIIDEIMNNGYVKDRAALGVKINTATNYFGEYAGLVVSEVIDGGGAQKAGIKVNDIIYSIDDEVVESFAQLSKILDSHNIGDIVKVSVIRNRKELSFDVELHESTN